MSVKRMFKQVVFLGSPGVGKGTYAKRAAPILKFGHISPGDLLRQRAKVDERIQSCLAQGQLVPEQIVFHSIQSELDNLLGDPSLRGVILDGFPRSVSQAVNWFRQDPSVKPDLVVEFKLPEFLLIQKLLGRRICSQCGNLFNVFDFENEEYRMPAMKPKIDGTCDNCSAPLIQRSDDTIEIITERLKMHNETHAELVNCVKQLTPNFVQFDVKTGIAQLPELIRVIKDHLPPCTFS